MTEELKYKFAFQPPKIQIAESDELNNALLEQDTLVSKQKQELEAMEIKHKRELDVLKERHISQLDQMALKVDCALQIIKGKSPLPMSLPPAAQTLIG
jgi:uncharacterized coiled-coil protein SlyX